MVEGRPPRTCSARLRFANAMHLPWRNYAGGGPRDSIEPGKSASFDGFTRNSVGETLGTNGIAMGSPNGHERRHPRGDTAILRVPVRRAGERKLI